MTWIFRNLIIVSRGQRPLTPTESAVHSPLGSGVCQRFKGGSMGSKGLVSTAVSKKLA